MNAHLPVLRDPDAPCAGFVEGAPTLNGSCETDGHYLCDECVNRKTCEGCGQRPAHCECPGGQYGPLLDFEIRGLGEAFWAHENGYKWPGRLATAWSERGARYLITQYEKK